MSEFKGKLRHSGALLQPGTLGPLLSVAVPPQVPAQSLILLEPHALSHHDTATHAHPTSVHGVSPEHDTIQVLVFGDAGHAAPPPDGLVVIVYVVL